jgi:6-phosphogluconate dehydrogenase
MKRLLFVHKKKALPWPPCLPTYKPIIKETLEMQIGVIGLGRMGANIARRLMLAGHNCVVFDKNAKAAGPLVEQGAVAATSLADLVEKLDQRPRAAWVMLPSGEITEHAVQQVGGMMDKGDILIDGGNSHFKDDVRRGRELAKRGVRYMDCGTSGGVWGLERGYCLMIGGERAAFEHMDPVFAALAPGLGDIPRTEGRDGRDKRAEQGYLYTGPCGSGHFVKMVHNGIEYGMMQAIAEGFDVLRNRNLKDLPDGERFDLNMGDIAEVWRRGSVISSWLLDLSASALAKDEKLDHFTGDVADSGEGRWTIEAAVEQATPVNVLAAALFARFRSRQEHNFGEKMLSAMRYGFGGHVELPEK